MEWWSIDFSELESLYYEESEALQKRLLEGANWEETALHRKKVIQLSTILYKRQNPEHFGNPAEQNNGYH